MIRSMLKIGIALLAIFVSFSVRAGTAVCSGTVQVLAYHQPGDLFVRLSSMNVSVLICNLNSDWVVPGSLSGNTPPASCRALHASLLTAKMAGTTISSMYFDGDQVPGSCNSFASWTRVNVRYFEQ